MRSWKTLVIVVAIAGSPAFVQAATFTNYTGLDGGNWTVDYQLHISNANNFSTGITYDTNNSASIATGSFNRVAYVMEVQAGSGPDQFVFASFDAAGFQTNASLLGVPTFGSGEIYQQNVNNLHVLAGGGVAVTTGTFAGSSGNLEFWPNDYGTNNAANVPGANSGNYDSGDERSTGGGYGSMQIFNHNTGGANETLMAFNAWNGGGGDLGIGNQVGGSGNPDWTFANNVSGYTIKDLQILVRETPEPSTLVSLGSLAAMGLILFARRHRKAV